MAKDRRVKSQQLIEQIKDWQDADRHLAMIGLEQRGIAGLEQAATEQINSIKKQLAEKVFSRQKKIDKAVLSLEAFAVQHKNEFKQKSRKLNFGIIGWRKSTFLKIKKNTLELIKQWFSRSEAAKYIRVKEAVDKDALKELTDERLHQVNARREEKEIFFAEPDLTKAAEY